ncbi:hypothetical protein IEQ11_01165 [Lysobacter capsici]|uniref:hypothetical protein n=1 Tax=Lysobacter capsici TaxID=435897 RepID=UPI00177B8FF3|nr:hypothetical protein [Lysobacter capsici]UOF15306.1 hypothetical protein IEQ11_01165 [Lysobacter capsici]
MQQADLQQADRTAGGIAIFVAADARSPRAIVSRRHWNLARSRRVSSPEVSRRCEVPVAAADGAEYRTRDRASGLDGYLAKPAALRLRRRYQSRRLFKAYS